MIRSASLTFISLLAVVPLSAIILSILSGFGVFQSLFVELQKYFFSRFFPTLYEEMLAYLETFVINARSLGLLGLLFFAVTSVLLMNTINTHFNAVWGSSSRKKLVEKFITYGSVIFMGALLIATGFTLSYILRATSSRVAAEGNSFWSILVFHVVPRIFSFFTFFLMIRLVPSGMVRFSSAVIGGIAGVIGWEIAKVIFLFSTTNIVQMSRIYGSLAAIPLFLIWLYTVWGIVLFSLESAWVYQHRGRDWIGKSHERLMPIGQIFLGIRVFLHIASSYNKNGIPPSIRNLSEKLYLSETEVEYITQLFFKRGLILETATTYPRYFPAAALEAIYLSEIIEAVAGTWKFNGESSLDKKTKQTILLFFASGKKPLEDYPVSEILN